MEATAPTSSATRRKQYYSVTDAVWGNRKIRGNAKLVALRLAKNWPRIFPSIAFLCEETGLSERTVQGCIRKLEQKGIIKTTRRVGTSSSYEFPRVSIPELGHDDSEPGDEGEGGEGGQNLPTSQPGQKLPTPSAVLAHPPGQNLPPNSRRLTLEPKGGRTRAGKPRSPRAGKPRVVPTPDVVFHTLRGWDLSDELRSEALALGISAPSLEARVNRLRATRLPPRSGVTDRDAYVRSLFPDWARWEAENIEKASRRAGLAPRSSRWGGAGGWEPSKKMRAYAARFDLPIDRLAEVFRDGELRDASNGADADRRFISKLVRCARAKGAELKAAA